MTFDDLARFIADEKSGIVIDAISIVNENTAMNYDELLNEGLVIEDEKLKELFKKEYGTDKPFIIIDKI